MKNNTFLFHSNLPPQTFIEQVHDTVISEKYHYFSRDKNGFLFQIDANHGGKIYFKCEVLVNENGGSTVSGQIIHESWYADTNQSIVGKIRDGVIIVFICIVLFPIFIFVGINNLISHLSTKNKLSPYEKKAIDFMINKMGCTQTEEKI